MRTKCEGNSMNIEELKRLAEAATPGPWVAAINTNMDNKVSHSFGDICQTGKDIGDAIFIAAANPAAVLELIDYVEYLRGKNREHFDACTGCDEELKRVSKQRDELLAALKDARELVEDWGAYAPAYMQEKHDLEGDMNKLDAAIAKVEKQA